MKDFIKTGCIICSVFLIFLLLMEWIPSNIHISTSASSENSPIYCGDRQNPRIAITFDTENTAKYLPDILDVLDTYNISATFFITGKWLDNYPEETRQLVDSGHELGNHGNTHIAMNQLSEEECRDEIIRLHKKTEELTGFQMTFFRCPFSSFNNTVIKVAAECGYQTVEWTCDSMDWKIKNAKVIARLLCKDPNLGNGTIIRMHVDTPFAAPALKIIIPKLKERGYEIVPLSQIL